MAKDKTLVDETKGKTSQQQSAAKKKNGSAKAKAKSKSKGFVARVHPKYKWTTVVAFSGREYNKTEYKPVPADFEHEIKGYKEGEVLQIKAA